MKTDKIRPENIDDFIALYPKGVQEKMKKLRATIRKAAPGVEETIKYGMPTFMLNGNLVYFSAWKNHIGFYPRMKAFKKELSDYEGGKGTVQFPFDKPLPLALIGKMVKVLTIAARLKYNDDCPGNDHRGAQKNFRG